MCFTIQRMNEIKQNSALECNFFVTLKKKEWTSVNQEIYIFTGCFFFTWITPIKNLNIQFYILYMQCVHVYCNIGLYIWSNNFQIKIFTNIFSSFCKSNFKKSLPKTKTLRLLHFVISITLRCTLSVGEQRERSCIGFDIHTLFHSAHVRRKILNGWKWIMIQVIGNLAKKMSNRLDRGVILLI